MLKLAPGCFLPVIGMVVFVPVVWLALRTLNFWGFYSLITLISNVSQNKVDVSTHG